MRDPEKRRASNKLAVERYRATDKGRRNHKGVHLRRYYNISIEDYESQLDTQDGRCAICRIEAENAPRGCLFVDHNHETGIMRGLICDDCNIGIGRMKDDPERLRAAADYVSRQPSVFVAGPRVNGQS